MIKDYIKERYGENLEIDWNGYLNNHQLDVYTTKDGFVTFKLEGDAAIIYDMYVKPYARSHTHAWDLHDHVLNKASGKRVMITFSEFKGKNHLAGIKAMKVAGFVPAFKTDEEFVFIKGI